MKKTLVGIVGFAALLGTPALGADLPLPVKAPPPPVFSWSGCYIGADVGYAWQRDKDDETDPFTGAASIFSPGASHPNGVKGGGYAGCNWQFAPTWVIGLEGDVEGADIAHDQGIYAPSTDFYESRTRFQSSIRGRLGYVVFDRSLLYVTGGAAFANIQDHYVGLEPDGITTNFTDSRVGWTVGAGWEYAFTSYLIGRVEYRHADFGTATNGPFFFCVTCAPVNESHRTTEEVIRLGIAFKFGGP